VNSVDTGENSGKSIPQVYTGGQGVCARVQGVGLHGAMWCAEGASYHVWSRPSASQISR
jgi:hypothetical protein